MECESGVGPVVGGLIYDAGRERIGKGRCAVEPCGYGERGLVRSKDAVGCDDIVPAVEVVR